MNPQNFASRGINLMIFLVQVQMLDSDKKLDPEGKPACRIPTGSIHKMSVFLCSPAEGATGLCHEGECDGEQLSQLHHCSLLLLDLCWLCAVRIAAALQVQAGSLQHFTMTAQALLFCYSHSTVQYSTVVRHVWLTIVAFKFSVRGQTAYVLFLLVHSLLRCCVSAYWAYHSGDPLPGLCELCIGQSSGAYHLVTLYRNTYHSGDLLPEKLAFTVCD